MANADYKLMLSPSIDTVFDIAIGGKSGDADKDKDNLKNVETDGLSKIRIRLILGGFVNAPWSITVTVKEGADTYETDPVIIEGRLGDGGGYFLNKDFPLNKKSS